jgi:Tol biopolymer transport system component
VPRKQDWLRIALAAIAFGCSDASAPSRPDVRVTVIPDLVESFASLGGAHTITAQVTDTLDAPRSDAVSWDVLPPSATVTVDQGIVTVTSNATAGDYQVRATVMGVSDTALVRVLPRPVGKLFFTAAVGAAYQVFVKDFATGGDAVQITTGSSASGGLAVDQSTGTVIASRGTLPNVDLFRMNADGTGMSNLTNDPALSNQGPSFNRVTGEIYFSRRGLTGTVTQIFRMASDGSGLTEVTSGTQGKTQPAVSPDGTMLSWNEQFPGFNLEIVTASIGGQNPVRLTDRTGTDGHSYWVSNSRLAWGAAALTEPDVFVADVPGGANAVNLTNGEGASLQPSAGCIPGTITILRRVDGETAVYQLDLTTRRAAKYTVAVPGTIGFARRLC